MSQSTVAGSFIPVSDPSKELGGGVYTSTVPENCTINLTLNTNDSGTILVNIAFTVSGTKKYQNYQVTSTTRVVEVPTGTSVIECTIQGGSGVTSGINMQILRAC